MLFPKGWHLEPVSIQRRSLILFPIASDGQGAPQVVLDHKLFGRLTVHFLAGSTSALASPYSIMVPKRAGVYHMCLVDQIEVITIGW